MGFDPDGVGTLGGYPNSRKRPGEHQTKVTQLNSRYDTQLSRHHDIRRLRFDTLQWGNALPRGFLILTKVLFYRLY
jgi:hypothetical protein